MCIKLTPIKRLYHINERNFSRRRAAGFVSGPIFYRFADVAVLRSENNSDKKSIVHTLSLKEGFFVGYIYKKGVTSFGGIKKETRVRVVPIYRYQFSNVYR